MERALSILGLIGMTALIIYLAKSRELAQDRAARLDRVLMDAEGRLIQLDADIEAVACTRVFFPLT
jgi:hypothetical protein